MALGWHFRALKLWFVLRSYGAEGLRQKIREHLAWTERLAELIRAAPGFELTTPVRFVIGQTYTTWRHVQEGWDLIQTSAAALEDHIA